MAEQFNPDDIVQESANEKESLRSDAQEVVQWFIDNQDSLFKRTEVLEDVSELLDCDESWANRCVSELVGDIADPVQQVVNNRTKYVGVIGYREFNDIGSYGYVHLDDLEGKKNRIICARCVEKHENDSGITHATEGVGSVNGDASWGELQNKIVAHYQDAHKVSPEEIEVGASLLSGTTIAGNTSVHLGNETFVDESGDTMSGDLNMGGSNDINLQASSNTSGEGRIANANSIDFTNQEHSTIGSSSLGFDNSEGGGGPDGGFIFNDSNGATNWIVGSSDSDYDIQKNGTDGAGVINFKT